MTYYVRWQLLKALKLMSNSEPIGESDYRVEADLTRLSNAVDAYNETSVGYTLSMLAVEKYNAVMQRSI